MKNTLLKNKLTHDGWIRKNIGILLAIAAIISISSLISDSFFTVKNLANVSSQVSVPLLFALGMALCLISGSIDLSVGTVCFCECLVFVVLSNSGLPVAVAAGITILLGAAVGLLMGFLIGVLGLAPFIVTLAVKFVAQGIVWVATDGGTAVVAKGDDFFALATRKIGGSFPVFIIFYLICIIICWFLLEKTKFGTNMIAAGSNKRAAEASGINVSKTLTMVHTVTGCLVAVAAICLALRLRSASPRGNLSYEGDAIAAAVLGGVSFLGGRGTIGGAVLGAVFLALLSNMMNILGVTDYYQLLLKGAVLIVSISLDAIMHRGDA